MTTWRRTLLGTLTAAGLLAGPGCAPSAPGNPAGEATGAPAVALDGFGAAVFQALVRGDTVALEGLRLSETEHNTEVYPRLPAGRAGGFPVGMAWENIQLRHYRDRGRQLDRLLGRDARYQGTFCRGGTERFEGFDVLRDCWVTFEDAAYGPARVQLFKDVLVDASGALRMFRIYDGEPRRTDAP